MRKFKMIAWIVAYFIVIALQPIDSKDSVCSARPLDQPLAYQDGDFIIVGIFNIGKVKYIYDEKLNVTVESCSHESTSLWRIQNALSFRETVLAEQDRFR